MLDETPNPQINISKVPIGGGVGGAIAAVAMMLVILVGIPRLWYLVPPALAAGCAVALILRFTKHKDTGASWILPATKNK